MRRVSVERRGGDVFQVIVEEDGSTTIHQVTADPIDVERLGAGVAAEDVIEASFRFLLDREPKESILSRFDLKVISHYFPGYDRKIGDYL